MNQRIITINDYQRLLSLKETVVADARSTRLASQLYDELTKARIIDGHTPEMLITMNSSVLLKELSVGREIALTITFPEDSNMLERKVSIISPIGIALLGRHVGEQVSWEIQGRKAHFEILQLTYQPEAAGHIHL